MSVMVCWKWLGAFAPAHAWVSHADEAALAVALRLAGATGSVTVLMSGPPAAEQAGREALARGATSAIRLEGAGDEPSCDVADALARVIGEAADADLVVCGDASLDRGSGAVPVFVAAHLGWPQALGLLELTPAGDGTLAATRRLDQGRRERLEIKGRAVVSVEAGAAAPQRAALGALRSARTVSIAIRPGPPPLAEAEAEAVTVPFRPRARVLPAPVGADALARVRALADSDAAAHATDFVELDPPAAAARIVELLTQWGYGTGRR